MIKNLNRDQQGNAVMWVIVVVVVVIIGLVGWRIADKNTNNSNKNSSNSSNSSSSNNSNSSSNSGVSSTCLATYHDTNLCHFSETSASFEKTAYTANITLTQSGTTSTMVLKSDGKGNTELTATGGGSTLNSITLNGNSYTQTTPGGIWLEYPSGTSAPVSNPTSSMDISLGSSTTFKEIGTVACGSLTCYKYSVTDSVSAGTTQYVYFDNSSYLLREWQSTDTNGDTTVMTITYGSVTISQPSPVESYTQAE